jgi:predicted DNA-binding transcriptional regulator AlpA
MMAKDPLLKTPEAANYLICHPVSLRRLRSEGKGPEYIRVSSRSVLYRKSALDEWLESKTVKPENN